MRIEITGHVPEYREKLLESLKISEQEEATYDIVREWKSQKIQRIHKTLEFLDLPCSGQIFFDDTELYALIPYRNRDK